MEQQTTGVRVWILTKYNTFHPVYVNQSWLYRIVKNTIPVVNIDIPFVVTEEWEKGLINALAEEQAIDHILLETQGPLHGMWAN